MDPYPEFLKNISDTKSNNTLPKGKPGRTLTDTVQNKTYKWPMTNDYHWSPEKYILKP